MHDFGFGIRMICLIALIQGAAIGLARDQDRHRVLKWVNCAIAFLLVWMFAPAIWNVVMAIVRPISFQDAATDGSELFSPTVAVVSVFFESLISAYVTILAIRVAARSEIARRHMVWAVPLLWIAIVANVTDRIPWSGDISAFLLVIAAGLLALAFAIPCSVVFWFYDSERIKAALFAESAPGPTTLKNAPAEPEIELLPEDGRRDDAPVN